MALTKFVRNVDDLSRAMVLGGGGEMSITLLREGLPLQRVVTPAPAPAA